MIPLDWIEAAVDRDIKTVPGPVIWGLDVARFGDDLSALAKRRTNTLLGPIQVKRQFDTMQVAGWVLREYEDTPPADQPSSILVDVIGIGAGVVDRLKEMGLPVVGINVAERPSSNTRYMRYRDELWFLGREWFESRDCSMVDDSDLIGEMSTVTYRIGSTGKVEVMRKDEMKKEGRPSPDRADAFLLTFGEQRYARKKMAPLKYDNRGIT